MPIMEDSGIESEDKQSNNYEDLTVVRLVVYLGTHKKYSRYITALHCF